MLQTLNLPNDIKQLSFEELATLASEIRAELIKIGDICGGHLASNLGVVELTLALHCILESPKDKMVWDVSHQCYVHKMLTGRLSEMYTIRQKGGLSGFAKIAESDHDTFGAGHASTALSAALGVAAARDLKGTDETVVSIIGDATLSGGMAFEALNNIDVFKKNKTNFVCILNDNDMSISEPTGSLATYMTKIRTSKPYNAAKQKFESILEKVPKIGVPLTRKIEKLIERTRDVVFDYKFGVIFEEFGFRYIGPIDGHNLPLLIAALNYVKAYPGPIMLHIITKKGKGHEAAEADPLRYHGVSPKKAPSTAPAPVTYTQVLGDTLCELAPTHPDLMVITPAMKVGSGLVNFAKSFPKQFVDVGIAEEHAVTYAAGLARNGIKPVLAIYSTFLQRGYDQLVHDVCLQKLPVIFALDRAGLVGEDGPTHHGVFDYAFMLHIPHLVIMAPKDAPELRAMLTYSLTQNSPISVRYPKGPAPVISESPTTIECGKSEIIYQSPGDTYDALIIAVGSMVKPALQAAQDSPLSTCVVNLRFLKPLDTDLLDELISKSRHIFVVEEGSAIGGVFTYILQSITTDKPLRHFHQLAIDDRFIDHAKVAELHDDVGLSATKIGDTIQVTCNDLTAENV